MTDPVTVLSRGEAYTQVVNSHPKETTMESNAQPATTPPRRSRTWLRRAGLLAAALVATPILLAACGGTSPSASSSGSSGNGAVASSGSSTYQKAIKYASCMRSHGVSNFPDPDSTGHFVISGVNVNSSQYQAAQNACKSLAPFGSTSPAQSQNNLSKALKFAQCMRSHGVANFPEPSQGSNGQITINGGTGSGIDPNSPQFQSAQQACSADLPTGAPSAGGAG